jgi:hypothetical protein
MNKKQLSCDGRGAAQRPYLHDTKPKKTGARSARALSPGLNPQVFNTVSSKITRFLCIVPCALQLGSLDVCHYGPRRCIAYSSFCFTWTCLNKRAWAVPSRVSLHCTRDGVLRLDVSIAVHGMSLCFTWRCALCCSWRCLSTLYLSLCCTCKCLSSVYKGLCAAPGRVGDPALYLEMVRIFSVSFSLFRNRFVCFGCIGKGSKHRNKPNNLFFVHATNRKTTETGGVSVCFGLFQFVSVCFGLSRKYFLISRTP